MSPLQPVLPFMKPPTHAAQLKRAFSCFQDLLRKARRKDLGTRWSVSWAHFHYPTSTRNPHKKSDTLQTNIQSCHWGSCIPICTDLSKNVQRPPTTEPSFAQSLHNISGKFTNQIQANFQKLRKFTAAEDLASDNYMLSFSKSYTVIHMKQIISAYLKC